MTIDTPLRIAAMSLVGLTLALAAPCRAASTADEDFAAIHAEAKHSFQDEIVPFLKSYCTDCHGDKKMKGGITFSPALKNPGGAAFSKHWKQALANVKTHDMPPEEVEKQPSEQERRRFMDWIGKIKFLSPK